MTITTQEAIAHLINELNLKEKEMNWLTVFIFIVGFLLGIPVSIWLFNKATTEVMKNKLW